LAQGIAFAVGVVADSFPGTDVDGGHAAAPPGKAAKDRKTARAPWPQQTKSRTGERAALKFVLRW
jgi:hypothetical protein